MYEYSSSDVYDFARTINARVKEKGGELHFEKCPYCGGGTNDKYTFALNLKNGAYKCLRASCGKQGHFVQLARDFDYDLGDWKDKQFKQMPQIKVVAKPKAVQYLENRGIGRATTEKYQITVKTNDENVLVFPFYDENNVLVCAKYRQTNKNSKGAKEWFEKDTKPILFGMNHCKGFEQLTITEGQIDSLTLAHCGIENVVSVPNGAMGFTWLNHCWDWINKFKKVIVFGDFENGKMTLIEKLRLTLKTQVFSVREKDYLLEKDANAIYQKYGVQAIIDAVDNAELQDIEYVKRLSKVNSVDMTKLPKIKTGLTTIDKAIGGLYLGQVCLLTGKRGEGKSTFMSQIVAEAINQDCPTFIYSGELPDYHFKYWLDFQIAGFRNLKKVEDEYGQEKYILQKGISEKINKWYNDKAFIFDNNAVDDEEFVGILKIVEDSICRYGIKLVCIDNLMTAIDDDPKSDIYRKQSMLVKNLKKIAKKYEVVVILIAHPNKNSGEFNNDFVSGSADITNAVDIVMAYGRSEKDKTYDSSLVITKNRLTGILLTGDDCVKLNYSMCSKRIMEEGETGEKIYSLFDDCKDGFRYIADFDVPFEEVFV